MTDSIHADRRRRRAEYYGLITEDETGALSMSNTKAELLDAATELGLEVDESNTKAELLEALEESEE